MPHKPDKEGGCWGSLSGGIGWDGFKRGIMGDCEKRPRPGKLTCWWHRFQETEAKFLKNKLDGKKSKISLDTSAAVADTTGVETETI